MTQPVYLVEDDEAGAHGRANGLDAAVEAATILRNAGERRLRLVLVGEGSERARLMAEAARRDLRNLTFLDPMPKTQVAALLSADEPTAFSAVTV